MFKWIGEYPNIPFSTCVQRDLLYHVTLNNQSQKSLISSHVAFAVDGNIHLTTLALLSHKNSFSTYHTINLLNKQMEH